MKNVKNINFHKYMSYALIVIGMVVAIILLAVDVLNIVKPVPAWFDQ